MLLALLACSSETPEAPAAAKVRTLTLAAYTTPREAYGKVILPAFAKHWKDKTGEDVKFEESYQGSGAQARAVKEGFEADVVALSLDPDVQVIADAGLISHDWRAGADGGIVTRSIAVIAVRAGNPKKIADWTDLARADVEVLTPNVRTSGGAMWNVLAIWGAGLRGHAGAERADSAPRIPASVETSTAERATADAKPGSTAENPGAEHPRDTRVTAGDEAGAIGLLRGVLGRVSVMDKGARESIVNFEKGVGDAAITYENEVLVAKKEGQAIDYVVPPSTILIENPVAVVDTYAKKHGNEDIAKDFVSFLFTDASQKAFAEHGLRPVDGGGLPAPADTFTIRDLGGWTDVKTKVFDKGGVYDQAAPKAE